MIASEVLKWCNKRAAEIRSDWWKYGLPAKHEVTRKAELRRMVECGLRDAYEKGLRDGIRALAEIKDGT